jgi:hypothetical protein
MVQRSRQIEWCGPPFIGDTETVLGESVLEWESVHDQDAQRCPERVKCIVDRQGFGIRRSDGSGLDPEQLEDCGSETVECHPALWCFDVEVVHGAAVVVDSGPE